MTALVPLPKPLGLVHQVAFYLARFRAQRRDLESALDAIEPPYAGQDETARVPVGEVQLASLLLQLLPTELAISLFEPGAFDGGQLPRASTVRLIVGRKQIADALDKQLADLQSWADKVERAHALQFSVMVPKGMTNEEWPVAFDFTVRGGPANAPLDVLRVTRLSPSDERWLHVFAGWLAGLWAQDGVDSSVRLHRPTVTCIPVTLPSKSSRSTRGRSRR